MTDRAEFVAGLRALAEFLEQHPAVAVPSHSSFSTYVFSRAELQEQARAATWDKGVNGNYAELTRSFGPLTYTIFADREQVCKRVVVGQREVPAQPAQPARLEDVVEWRCEGSWLGERAAEEEPAL